MTIGSISSAGTRRNRLTVVLCIMLTGLGQAPAVLHAAARAGSSAANAATAQRAQRALAAIRTSHPALATGNVDLIARNALVNEHGRLVVHAQQAFQGHPVWGSSAIIHAEASGVTRLLSSNISDMPTPAGNPRLTAQQAIGITMKSLALRGPSLPPTAELIVFPTRFHSDVALKWNPAKFDYQLDRRRSALTIAPADPYVWAYEVHLFAKNRVDGVQDRNYVVDARTGAILRVTAACTTSRRQIRRRSVRPIRLRSASATASTAARCPLDTTQHADGTFALVDLTRGQRTTRTCTTALRRQRQPDLRRGRQPDPRDRPADADRDARGDGTTSRGRPATGGSTGTRPTAGATARNSSCIRTAARRASTARPPRSMRTTAWRRPGISTTTSSTATASTTRARRRSRSCTSRPFPATTTTMRSGTTFSFGMFYSDGTRNAGRRSVHRRPDDAQSEWLHLADHARHHRPRDDARRDGDYRRR